MEVVTNLINVDDYNNLLKNYRELLSSLAENPIIRPPNMFYEYLDQLLINRMSNDKMKYYVVRNVLPNIQFLKGVFDAEHFYVLSIECVGGDVSNGIDDVVTTINKLSMSHNLLTKPFPAKTDKIEVLLLMYDVTVTSSLRFHFDSGVEVYIPSSIFSFLPLTNNYFKMIINRAGDTNNANNTNKDDIEIIDSDLSSHISLDVFHNVFPYLATDVYYLTSNIDDVTNEIYTALEYFSFSDSVLLILSHYKNLSLIKRSDRLYDITYYVDLIFHGEQNIRYGHIYEITNNVLLTKQYNDAFNHNMRIMPNLDHVDINVESSTNLLRKDLVLFKKLLMFCEIFLVDGGKDADNHVYTNQSYVNENAIRNLIDSLSYILNKFSLLSPTEHITQLVKRYETLLYKDRENPKMRGCIQLLYNKLNNKKIIALIKRLVKMYEQSISCQETLLETQKTINLKKHYGIKKAYFNRMLRNDGEKIIPLTYKFECFMGSWSSGSDSSSEIEIVTDVDNNEPPTLDPASMFDKIMFEGPLSECFGLLDSDDDSRDSFKTRSTFDSSNSSDSFRTKSSFDSSNSHEGGFRDIPATEIKPKPKPKPKPETKPKLETKPEPKLEFEIKLETKPETKSEPETKPEPKSEPESKPKNYSNE